MNQTKIQPAAAADADDAANWYEAQRVGLGIEFLLELDAAIDRATETPKSYEELYLGVRRVLVERFPYSVYSYSKIRRLKYSPSYISTNRLLRGNHGFEHAA